MLNADDPETFFAVRELKRVIKESPKPLVFWIGAGASRWLGYPLWGEFARDLRREFFQSRPGFDNAAALKLIAANDFPQLFQMCRDLDRARYFRFLSQKFLPRPEAPLYLRFADTLAEMVPLSILTTNIDEALEQRFPNAAIFQRSDISACVEQLEAGRSFIAKIHGSRSAIESAVFTYEDYQNLKGDTAYLSTLKHIFRATTVVFLGYSLSDQYVIDLLSERSKEMSLFGSGPHFVVSSDFSPRLQLRRIGYSLRRFPDHRSAITVLDLIKQVRASTTEVSAPSLVAAEPRLLKTPDLTDKSAYFISDFMPPGTWETSQTLGLAGHGGIAAQCIVGLGFTNDEISSPLQTGVRDLITGLTCFDFVYLPLSALHRAQAALGDGLHELIKLDVLRFIHLQHDPAIIFREHTLLGDVSLIRREGGAGDPGARIRAQLTPTPGKEAEAERLFSDIEARVTVFDEGERVELPSLVRAAFMMPDVARLLGIGDAIVPSQIPTWLGFPCLRMAHLVQTGAVCDSLGIRAAKISFGGAKLTSGAFGVQHATEFADRYANYVLSGRFSSDIRISLGGQSLILRAILRFRESIEGEAFRREVRDQLLTNATKDFTASINAGLARSIPLPILERARDRALSLLTENFTHSPVPAVWTDSSSDDVTKLWRAKSRKILSALMHSRGMKGDDPCLCGSGDKLRLCCLAPLRN